MKIFPDRKSIITIPQPFPPPSAPAQSARQTINDFYFRENSCKFEASSLLQPHQVPPINSLTPHPPSENIISSEHQVEETEANTTMTDKMGDVPHSKENSS